MITHTFYKAQRTLRDREVPSVRIVIDKEIPDAPSLEAAEKFYQEQAESLCRAIYLTLPGGVFDRLLAEMLKKKLSMFVVSHAEPES